MAMSDMTVKQLKEVASQKGITLSSKAKKDEIITAIESASKTKASKKDSSGKGAPSKEEPKAIRRGGEY